MINIAKIKNAKIKNIEDVLVHLSLIKATHGKGKMYASVLSRVNFTKAYALAKKMQKKGLLPYGPFVIRGTNCSRFVASIIRSSNRL